MSEENPQENRFIVLKIIYDISDCDIHKIIFFDEVLRKSPVELKRLMPILNYLDDKNLIKAQINQLQITVNGIDEIEKSRSDPNKSTSHFPANIYNNIFNAPANGIQQGQNNTQNNDIESDVDSSKNKQLPSEQTVLDRILDLESEVHSFDFEGSITDELRNQYESLKEQTNNFVEKYIEKMFRQQAEPLKRISFRETYEEIIATIRQVYISQHLPLAIKYKEMRLEVIANSLVDTAHSDKVILSLKFKTGAEKIYCHEFNLSIQEEEVLISRAEFIVLHNNEEIETSYVPSTLKHDRFILFFKQPLPANSGDYTIICKSIVRNFIADNKLSLKALRADGKVNQAKIILKIPRGVSGITLTGNIGQLMDSNELNFIYSETKYKILGWKAINLNPDSIVSIDIKRN